MPMTEFEICPDCSVAIGETHLSGCDITRCKAHGVQLFKCHLMEESNACVPTKFDGFFPGTQEATERGWYVCQNIDKKWENCDSDHPEASPDINRVMKELIWDSQLEKYI
jgi:hypothetical protein